MAVTGTAKMEATDEMATPPASDERCTSACSRKSASRRIAMTRGYEEKKEDLISNDAGNQQEGD